MTEAFPDSIPATELVYHLDSYARELDATVIAVDQETNAVALDRTIAYPGGGGQPFDLGTLTSANGAWRIESGKSRETSPGTCCPGQMACRRWVTRSILPLIGRGGTG